MRASLILALAVLLLTCPLLHAQQRSACGIPVPDRPSDRPIVRVVSVHFEDVTEIPRPALTRLASEMKQELNHREDWYVEPCEGMRNAYQKRGYFLAEPRLSYEQVGGDSEYPQMAIIISAGRPGLRFSLGTITFKNQQALPAAALRPLFPLRNGDIFNTDLVRKGLENLRKAYGSRGYINFTSVPDTVVDDSARTVSLVIDVDEGKQFRWHAITIRGAPAGLEKEMRAWWSPRIGKPMNSADMEAFYVKYAKLMPAQPVRPIEEAAEIRRDESTAYVDLIFTFGATDEVFFCGP